MHYVKPILLLSCNIVYFFVSCIELLLHVLKIYINS